MRLGIFIFYFGSSISPSLTGLGTTSVMTDYFRSKGRGGRHIDRSSNRPHVDPGDCSDGARDEAKCGDAVVST